MSTLGVLNAVMASLMLMVAKALAQYRESRRGLKQEGINPKPGT